MAKYAIKDLEHYTGIKAHTIRIWEKRYGIVQPERTETNIRSYSDEDLKKLLNIAMLNRHGHKISELVNLPDKKLCSLVLEMSAQKKSSDLYIDNLMLSMVDFDEQKFEKTLTNIIIYHGFEKTVVDILYPFFVRIGYLWQTGHIQPGQEHFITNLFRQKLIVAIDQLNTELSDSSKTFLLFLPEWEMHETGLLFFHYLIKKSGHKVVYLGQQLPAEDLVSICQSQEIDYLLTYSTLEPKIEDLEQLKSVLKNEISSKKQLIVSGYNANLFADIPQNNTIIIPQGKDFKLFLNNL